MCIRDSDGSTVTFNINSGNQDIAAHTIAIAIADHHMNSREIIDHIISNSNFIDAFGYSNNLTKVVTIKDSDPDLAYEIVEMTKVNDFDIFVYYERSDKEAFVRQNVNYGSNIDPHLTIETATSSGGWKASIFSSSATIQKYYISRSAVQNYQDMSTSVIIRDSIRNSVTTIQDTTQLTTGHLYLYVEDSNGNTSSIKYTTIT